MINPYGLDGLMMCIIAILNGALREKSYGKYVHELSAHQLSTVTGIVLFGAYIWVLTGIRPIQTPKEAVTIGCLWLVMTLAFEFIFGHYVMGHPWTKLLHDYNLLKGRVWVLVLFWITSAPYLCYRIRSVP